MKSRIAAALVAALLVGALAGCASPAVNANVPAQPDGSNGGYVKPEPDPLGAIEKIYESISVMGLEYADDTVMTEIFGFDLSDVKEYYVKYSSGRFGLADVFIILPAQGATSRVLNALQLQKNARISQYENYDVLDACRISKEAVIYDYAGYVIMLMLHDNEAAAEIIEEYIPR